MSLRITMGLLLAATTLVACDNTNTNKVGTSEDAIEIVPAVVEELSAPAIGAEENPPSARLTIESPEASFDPTQE